MSKVGKKPIIIPSGISSTVENGFIVMRKGSDEFKVKLLPYIKVVISDSDIVFSKEQDIKQARANWGTMRALTQNAIDGLANGFKKNLEIEGVGFRAVMEGETLSVSVGYSHPVKFTPPKGIKIIVEKNVISVSGLNKEIVGQVAADIRAIKKPEPYKGKGIRYQGERIRRKAGKKVAGSSK